MKIKIWKDEAYPVFGISPSFGDDREVPAATVRRWKRIERAYEAMQGEMRKAWEDAYFSPRKPAK